MFFFWSKILLQVLKICIISIFLFFLVQYTLSIVSDTAMEIVFKIIGPKIRLSVILTCWSDQNTLELPTAFYLITGTNTHHHSPPCQAPRKYEKKTFKVVQYIYYFQSWNMYKKKFSLSTHVHWKKYVRQYD